jgi:hypothetical protein
VSARIRRYERQADAFTIRRVMDHANVFVKFTPASLTYFWGIDSRIARAHCAHLVRVGKLQRLTDLDAAWYRATV